MLSINIVLIGVAAFIATYLGGLVALKFKDRLHLISGFSAGAIIGVALFDLLPESIELSTKDANFIASIIALGFLLYLILDRLIIKHSHSDHECEKNGHRGILGAGSLSFHSLLDGIAVGVAFQVSSVVGIIVTAAVLTHDFSDGINTVNMILKNGGTKIKALKWLLVDSLAPCIGVISTLFITLDSNMLSYILALFCGFFLYIGASDLLPESHHNHSTKWTTVMTILGMVVIFFAIKVASI